MYLRLEFFFFRYICFSYSFALKNMEIVTSDARIFIYIYIAILLLDILNVIERESKIEIFFFCYSIISPLKKM